MDWQERFESSEFGRGLITAFILVTLLAVVAINLPDSTIRQHLMRPAQPYLDALGLDQNWGMFAPDPRTSVIDFHAVVRYDDGSSLIWRFPQDGPLIGAYRDYRWRKWAENTINDANSGLLWQPAALWVARRMKRPGRSEQQITLIRRWSNLNPPGAHPDHGSWFDQAFYTLRITKGNAP